jgi:hypothetical protein
MRYFRSNTFRAALLGAFLAFPIQGVATSVQAQSVNTIVASSTVRIPAGTKVELEFVETLSSKINTTGQTFALRLRDPIVIDGQIVVPAGALGGGEVIDAGRSGMGGRSGKLILSGRFLEYQGQRVRIRGLQSVLAGDDRSRTAVNTVILVPYVGFLGGFIQGGDIEVPSGTRAQAQLATDIIISTPPQLPQPAAQTSTPASTTTPAEKGNP